MESTIKGSLNRKELAKRLEAKRHELSARIREAEADAAGAASSHVSAWKEFLGDLENTLERGIEKAEEATVERLIKALEDDDRDSTTSPRPPA